MTIGFENDSEVIVYALEKVIAFAQEHQYFFVANCAWWIASIIGLDNHLTRYIDRIVLEQSKSCLEISPEPRDIARDVSSRIQGSSDITTD